MNDPWAAYCAARYVTLSIPSLEVEENAERKAAAALASWLTLETDVAEYHARRCTLFRRERWLHDGFTIDLEPGLMRLLLDRLTVVGTEHAADAIRNRGVLLVSLHYSLYSSVLIWWLTRVAAQGVFRRLFLLFRSTSMGRYLLHSRRLIETEANGLFSQANVHFLDRTILGPAGAAARMLNELKAGNTVFLLADAALRPPGCKSLAVRVGNQNVGLARGVSWLAEKSRCAVIPLYIRPHNDEGHAIVLAPPADAKEAVQFLIDQTILVDPSPWDGWFHAPI